MAVAASVFFAAGSAANAGPANVRNAAAVIRERIRDSKVPHPTLLERSRVTRRKIPQASDGFAVSDLGLRNGPFMPQLDWKDQYNVLKEPVTTPGRSHG